MQYENYMSLLHFSFARGSLDKSDLDRRRLFPILLKIEALDSEDDDLKSESTRAMLGGSLSAAATTVDLAPASASSWTEESLLKAAAVSLSSPISYTIDRGGEVLVQNTFSTECEKVN